MTFVEMSVDIDCAGCKRKIRKALEKLKGIDDIDINMEQQKVTVLGWAQPDKVLKAVRKTDRRAELWSDQQRYFCRQDQYYQQQQYQYSVQLPIITRQVSPQSSYRYVSSTVIDEQMCSLFSDENPHACSLM